MNIRCKAVIPFPAPKPSQAGAILPALAVSLLLHILLAGIFPALVSNPAGTETVNYTGTKLRLSLSRPQLPAAPEEKSLPVLSQQEIQPDQPEPVKDPAEQPPEEILASSSQKEVPEPARKAKPVAQQETVTDSKAEETVTSNTQQPEGTSDDADLSTPASADRIDPVKAWLGELQERLNRNKIYPYQAIRRHLQGEVTLKVVLRPDGSLESADILSGHRTFHSPSLKALKKSLPLPPADSSQSITVILSLKYELE
ncbi:MAG: energy transducer TonB [Endozoicomonas sp.]